MSETLNPIAPPEKPGYKTTEFYKSIAANIFGLLVIFGIFTPDQSSDLIIAVEKFSGAVITAVATGAYAMSRAFVKKK